MSSFLDYLEGKGFSKSTRASIYKEVVYFINWAEDEHLEVDKSTYNDVLGYIHYLKKRGVSQKTIESYLNSLKHYFSWQVKEECILENPIRKLKIQGVKKNHLYKIVHKSELEKLYESYKIEEEQEKSSHLVSKRNKCIIGLMVYQGLGAGDLGRLKEKDLQLRDGKILIEGSRKSNKRELKLESVQIMDLMEYSLQTRKALLELSDKETNSLFISTGKSTEFRSIMYKLMQKLHASNEQIESSNQIRTSVITDWLKRYNLREVQYMAGHKYVSSTESYLINDLEDLQAAVNKYHPF